MKRFEFGVLYHYSSYEVPHECTLVTNNEQKVYYEPPIGLLYTLSMDGWEIRQIDDHSVSPRGSLQLTAWLQREVENE